MKTYKQLYADAKKAKQLKQLTPEYHRWEKAGDQVIGAFISSNTVQSRLGGTSYNQYLFETDEGLVKFALGRNADSEFSAMLTRGIVYAVTFRGKEKLVDGRQVNRFELEEIGVSELVNEPDEEEGADVIPFDKE